MPLAEQEYDLFSITFRQCKLARIAKTLEVLMCLSELSERRIEGAPGLVLSQILGVKPGHGLQGPCLLACNLDQTRTLLPEGRLIEHEKCYGDPSDGHARHD